MQSAWSRRPCFVLPFLRLVLTCLWMILGLVLYSTFPFHPGTAPLRLVLRRPSLHAVLLSGEKLDKPPHDTANDHGSVISLHLVWRLINYCLLNCRYWGQMRRLDLDVDDAPPLWDGHPGVTASAVSGCAQCFFMQSHSSFKPLLSNPSSSLG